MQRGQTRPARRTQPVSIFDQQDGKPGGMGAGSRGSSAGMGAARGAFGKNLGQVHIGRTRAGADQSGLLSSLRETQIVGGKWALPVELISVILDYSPPATLISCARVSRRLKDIVYDETRWIKRLQLLGTWDEDLARKHKEEAQRRRSQALASKSSFGIGRNGQTNGNNTLFDVLGTDDDWGTSQGQVLSDGFADLVLSGGTDGPLVQQQAAGDIAAATVLKEAKSIPGQARQTYGRIHALLSPLYRDATSSKKQSAVLADPLALRVTRDVRQQAQILANLERFARTDDESGWAVRQENLSALISVFENRVLNNFRAAYGSGDEQGLRAAVDVMITLGKGSEAVDTFVECHPLLAHGERNLADPHDCVEGVTHGHVDLGPSQRLFEKLAVACSDQSRLIDSVFPPGTDALTQLSTAIGASILAPFIKELLDVTQARDQETFLWAFGGVLEQAMRFSVSVQPTKASPSTFRRDLQLALLESFTSHAEAYLNGEVELFKAKAEAEVKAWDQQLSEQTSRQETYYMSNVNRQAAKRDFLSSFKKVVMMPVNAVAALPLPGSGNKAGIRAEASHTNVVNIGASTNGFTSSLGEAPATELAAKAAIMNSRLEGIKSLFSIELALNLIQHAKSAIERLAIVASFGGEKSAKTARHQCETIFIRLLDILGQQHIKHGFDTAVNHLSSYNPRQMHSKESSSNPPTGVAPLTTFLELVNVGDLIQQMLDVFFAQELVAARLTDTDDFLNPATKAKKAFEQMLDERVAAGMSKGIDVLIDEVEYLCATTQGPTDYNPGAADGTATPTGHGALSMGIVDIGPTKTAVDVVHLVQTHTELLVGSTEKTMLDVFFQEVGLRLFGTLCKHIKRQRISVDGAIKLISDINLYSSFITTLKQKPLGPYFTALRELSQIYLVDCGPVPSSSGLMSPILGNGSGASAALSAQQASKQNAKSAKALQADRMARAKELATIIADNDRYKGVFGADEVLEFAERRADWYFVRGDVERAMYGIGCVVM